MSPSSCHPIEHELLCRIIVSNFQFNDLRLIIYLKIFGEKIWRLKIILKLRDLKLMVHYNYVFDFELETVMILELVIEQERKNLGIVIYSRNVKSRFKDLFFRSKIIWISWI